MAAINGPVSTGLVARATAGVGGVLSTTNSTIINQVGKLWAAVYVAGNLITFKIQKINFVARALPPVVLLGVAAKTAIQANDFIYRNYGPKEYAKTQQTLAKAAIAIASLVTYGTLALLFSKRPVAGTVVGLLAGSTLAYVTLSGDLNARRAAYKTVNDAENKRNAAYDAVGAAKADLPALEQALKAAPVSAGLKALLVDIAEKDGALTAFKAAKAGWIANGQTDEQFAQELAKKEKELESLHERLTGETNTQENAAYVAAKKAVDDAKKNIVDLEAKATKAFKALEVAKAKRDSLKI
jgi:hypothetical protein